MENMKNGLHKFREVNHKEHRRQMYEQWGNRIISKINMWENSKEFKSINELVLYIYEGLLGEEVKNGEIIFY